MTAPSEWAIAKAKLVLKFVDWLPTNQWFNLLNALAVALDEARAEGADAVQRIVDEMLAAAIRAGAEKKP